MRVILVAVVSKNRVIANNGVIPWRISEDLERFRSLTMDHAVIMGRKTYEAIGHALVSRRNIVLSRGDFHSEGIEVFSSLDSAFGSCEGDVFVIGGGQVFSQAIKFADRLELTVVDEVCEGDCFFPEFLEFHEVGRIRREGFDFVTLARSHPSS